METEVVYNPQSTQKGTYLRPPLEGSYERILSKRAVSTMNLDCWMSDSGAFFQDPGWPARIAHWSEDKNQKTD